MNRMRYSIARYYGTWDLVAKETTRHSPAEFQTRYASGLYKSLSNLAQVQVDAANGSWWRSLMSLLPSLMDSQLLAAPKKKVGACFSATSSLIFNNFAEFKLGSYRLCRSRLTEKAIEVLVSIYDSYPLYPSVANANEFFHHTQCHRNVKMMIVPPSTSGKDREFERKEIQTTS